MRHASRHMTELPLRLADVFLADTEVKDVVAEADAVMADASRVVFLGCAAMLAMVRHRLRKISDS